MQGNTDFKLINMKYAPIRIPTLCRSAHFIRLIESLKRNSWAKYTEVFVGLDYPPNEKYRRGWQEICDYLGKGDFSAFAAFHVIKRTENYGAFRNSTDLIHRIYDQGHDRCISLEDDLEVSPNFIEYMDKCLEAFEDDPDVVCVTGYSYPVDWKASKDASCMRQDFNASTWGRGTWRKKSEDYRPYIYSGGMLKKLTEVIRSKRYLRMIDACLKEYIRAALLPSRAGLMSKCTDIGMRAYLAVDGKYFVSPIVSKVLNHGFDGSGLYCQDITHLDGKTAGTYNYPEQPIDESDSFEIRLNDEAYLEENRRRLNAFDYRSPSQMRKTRLLLWLMKNVGIWAAKTYIYATLPFDCAVEAFVKAKRMLRR